MRWRFLNQLKKMKSEKLFDLQAVEKLDQIINVRNIMQIL